MNKVRSAAMGLGLWCAVACGADPVAKPAAADSASFGDAAADGGGADSAKGDGAVQPERLDLQWDVAKPGPYRVGYRAWSHSYIPAAEDPSRTIGVAVWYPTTDKAGAPANYSGIMDRPEVFADASLAAPAVPPKYPVLVYSHGYSGWAGGSPWLCEHFASHGWVVIAPDHTGNLLPDHDAPKPTALWWWRARDVSAAIDAVAALPATDPLAGKPDVSKVVMSGHSFGGYTTWVSSGGVFDQAKLAAACAEGKGLGGACTAHDLAQYAKGLADPRIVAAMALAPGNGDLKWMGPSGVAKINVPVLLMTGTADGGHIGGPIWQELQPLPRLKDSLWVDVQDGCHALWGFGECLAVPKDQGYAINLHYPLAFARRWLLGDSGAKTTELLAGQGIPSPLATVKLGKTL